MSELNALGEDEEEDEDGQVLSGVWSASPVLSISSRGSSIVGLDTLNGSPSPSADACRPMPPSPYVRRLESVRDVYRIADASKPFAKSDGKCTDAGSFEAVPLSCVSGHCWPAPDSPVRVSLPNSDEGFLEGAVPVTVVVLRRTSG